MNGRRIFELLIVTILSLTGGYAFAQPPANYQPPVDVHANEQVIMVPGGPGHGEHLQTTVFRPPGAGPFPLLVMNHGKDPGRPRLQPRDRFWHLARAFVQRGYAVMVPMRLGFAGSSGASQFFGCNIADAARAQAQDVVDVLQFARSQAWVDPDRIVVAGQSLGGLVSMSFSMRSFPGVRGILNFAGGLRNDSENCDWRSSLEVAFIEFGQKNLIPSLWLYGQNDSLFGPDLVARLYGAFERAGGRARLFQYPSFKNDAHGMVADRDGELVWRREVESFLSAIGMPAQIVFELPPIESPPETRFAHLEAVEAVPHLNEKGRAAYRDYLTKYSPRAFALSASGAWTWAEGGEDVNSRALQTCQAKSSTPCRLYSVDQKVVWKPEASLP